jgi:uncharacterized cupin superfamily protein
MNTNAATLAKILIRNFDGMPMQDADHEPVFAALGGCMAPMAALCTLGAGIHTVAPGQLSGPYQCDHFREKMYLILDGTATLLVASEKLPLRMGDIVVIPPGPAYPHQLCNDAGAPLRYLAVDTDTPINCIDDTATHPAHPPRHLGQGFHTLLPQVSGMQAAGKN